jgi:beta-glucanase (GH16 family)
MLPVTSWEEIIPGDGFAYLRFDADRSNDRDQTTQRWPFQMISLSSVTPGHRLEMRAKNTVISGVGSFIFTYQEADGIFDEIDIEIVGDDAATLPDGHPTDETGWTDARFNTWANSDTQTSKPHVTHKKPIVDASGQKTSHSDHQFHTYTIDWREDRVDFFIDGVHQQTIDNLVPDSPARLLVGVRHMSWTGPLDWEGTQTMIIDWIRVEPLDR